jgi:hypothetical protein
MQRIFIKKCFLFTVGSVCRVKGFTTGYINSLMDVRKSQMMTDQVRKCLRQQSKDFYADGFDALEKRLNKCINVSWRICGEINVFSRFEYHMVYVLYPFVTCLLTLRRILRRWFTTIYTCYSWRCIKRRPRRIIRYYVGMRRNTEESRKNTKRMYFSPIIVKTLKSINNPTWWAAHGASLCECLRISLQSWDRKGDDSICETWTQPENYFSFRVSRKDTI